MKLNRILPWLKLCVYSARCAFWLSFSASALLLMLLNFFLPLRWQEWGSFAYYFLLAFVFSPWWEDVSWEVEK